MMNFPFPFVIQTTVREEESEYINVDAFRFFVTSFL